MSKQPSHFERIFGSIEAAHIFTQQSIGQPVLQIGADQSYGNGPKNDEFWVRYRVSTGVVTGPSKEIPSNGIGLVILPVKQLCVVDLVEAPSRDNWRDRIESLKTANYAEPFQMEQTGLVVDGQPRLATETLLIKKLQGNVMAIGDDAREMIEALRGVENIPNPPEYLPRLSDVTIRQRRQAELVGTMIEIGLRYTLGTDDYLTPRGDLSCNQV